MKIHRRILSTLTGVYSVARVNCHGRSCIAAASEARGGSCLLLDPEQASSTLVWSGPGGTMSIVPTHDAHFFAVQQFYAGFDAAASVIVEATAPSADRPWEVAEKLKLPYLHRLALVAAGAYPSLLACTLCSGKDNVDDWSKPGAVFHITTGKAGKGVWEVVPVLRQLRRNHGLSMTRLDGKQVALVGAMEGLFSITLPGSTHSAWEVQQILDTDISDVIAMDWDEDGHEELMTIEPFHGDRFVFYKRDAKGKWHKIHELPCQLGHSVWAGRALGRPTIIAGERLGEGRIQLVFPTGAHPKDWGSMLVDRNTGGTNVAVWEATENALTFVSANNDRNEVVHYHVAR